LSDSNRRMSSRGNEKLNNLSISYNSGKSQGFPKLIFNNDSSIVKNNDMYSKRNSLINTSLSLNNKI
jgi:hypothetical protein